MMALNPTMPMAIVRARIGTGIGKRIISVSGQCMAKATTRPSTAPDAPTKGAIGVIPESSSEKTAAPMPQ